MSSGSEQVATRGERAYVIAMCAIIGAAFAYAACEWGQWPRLIYLPLHETVTFERTSAISIFYYGLFAWGLGGLLVGASLGAIACRLFPRPWPARTLRLFGAWAITALLLAAGYFTWSLFPWTV